MTILMEPGNKYSPSRQAGFSLVEIMVGLAVGLLATLVIMQVFSVFEGQKRTTTGTADAQTNGSTALYTIGRELQMAGYGLLPITVSPLNCTALTVGGALDATTPNRISPVVIADGGTLAGASDSITIRYGTSPDGGIPSPITTPLAYPNVHVDNNMGCLVPNANTALVVNGANCTLTAASAVAGSTTTVTLADTTNAIVGANLSCLGAWNEITFRVNNTVVSNVYLERQNIAISPAFFPVITDIVNIQAQYGISATFGSNQVTQWVNAVDGQPSGDWGANLTTSNRNRIKAVRIAVVARNGLLEKENVTFTCTTAKGTINNGPCAWDDADPIPNAAPKIDLSNYANWQRYRYRVFETIIPLRNVIWSRESL